MPTTRNSDNPKPVTNPDHLYFTDNGRVLCGEHLGMSAMYTGYDISGQKIVRVTPAEAEAAKRDLDCALDCEDCGKAVA